jgi:uncharacterized membrane protein YhhN
MSGVVFLLLAITAAVAVFDWAAVQVGMKPLEYVAKPLTMVVLIAAVLAMEPSSSTARAFFVAALVFSLIGDVFLMLPDRERYFVFGLGSFLIGHLAYIPGLWLLGFDVRMLLVGLLVVSVFVTAIGRQVVAGVRASEPKLTLPVTVYMGVISVMVVSAFATARPIAIAGALLFYASDALIAWNGFIKEHRWGKLAIIVTYHAAQVGLALALL